MARPKSINIAQQLDEQAIPDEVKAVSLAAYDEEVALKYKGEIDPTKLDASDLNYTHAGSPAHIAWLKFKGLVKGL